MSPLNLLDLRDQVGSLRRSLPRILAWGLALAIAGYAISYAIPPTYRGEAVILPPEEDELASSLSMVRRNLGGFGRLAGPYFTEADMALAILRSRKVATNVAHSLDLQRVYKAKDLETTIKKLQERVRVRVANDGTISVTAEDRTSERSAAIANSYLRELDEQNKGFRSARARRTREFLERRVSEADSVLHHTEKLAAAYQKGRGDLLLPPDGKAAADAAAPLMAEKFNAEVELALLRQVAAPGSDELRRAEERARQFRRQLGDLPASQVGGSELVRRVGIQQQVLALLMGQLEEARIREAMDTPTIQVLDEAQPSKIRAWPRRSWLAAIGMLLGLVIGFADPIRRFGPRRFAG